METTLRQKYKQLEQDLSYEFSFLTAKNEFNFFKGEEFTTDDADEWTHNVYKVRNNITGNCLDVYVLLADKAGIYIAEIDDAESQYFIRFSELFTTLDRIRLIEEMEEFLAEQQ